MDKVGKDGVITVEEGRASASRRNTPRACSSTAAISSAYFVTNPDRMEAVLEDPLILITDKKISSVPDMLPALEKGVQQGKPMLIIAEDIDGEALATLVEQAVAPSRSSPSRRRVGDRRKEMLRDIATLTGGTVISEEVGRKLDSGLRPARRRRDQGRDDRHRRRWLAGRDTCDDDQGPIEETTSDYDREKLQERLAKLSVSR